MPPIQDDHRAEPLRAARIREVGFYGYGLLGRHMLNDQELSWQLVPTDVAWPPTDNPAANPAEEPVGNPAQKPAGKPTGKPTSKARQAPPN